MKKLVALLLSLVMVFSMVACGANKGTDADKKAQTDMEYVKEKGKLVVGITEFAPMDYKDEDGNWIGFDADMATAFAKSLGVDVEFVLIDWNNKIMELDGKSIDCVWNGMTLTEEVLAGMKCSKPYCENAQVVVVRKEDAEKYQTEESVKGLNFAVEDGGAAQELIEPKGWKFTAVPDQAQTLMEVSGKTADATVIDLLMAAAMIGDNTSYKDLTFTVRLNEEEYGVGFRKNSDLAEALNDFFVEAYADGSMMKCAQKYGVSDAIIPQE
jgi:polar amino acid transport system substrate-binding protein